MDNFGFGKFKIDCMYAKTALTLNNEMYRYTISVVERNGNNIIYNIKYECRSVDCWLNMGSDSGYCSHIDSDDNGEFITIKTGKPFKIYALECLI